MKYKTLQHGMAGIIMASLCLFCSCAKPKQDEPLFIVTGFATNQIDGSKTDSEQVLGSISGIYNPISKKIAYNINWENLTAKATLAVIYQHNAAKNTDSILYQFPVAQPDAKGVLAGHLYLSNNEAKALLSNELHYAICTIKKPTGEINATINVIKP